MRLVRACTKSKGYAVASGQKRLDPSQTDSCLDTQRPVVYSGPPLTQTYGHQLSFLS